MKIFVDTADIDEIRSSMEFGVVDGVTTNPSLIKKAQEKHGIDDMKDYVKKILEVSGDRPVSLEVTETSYEAMKGEAMMLKRLFGKYKNMVVKIPVNPSMDFENQANFDGLKLIKELSDDDISVNTTVVMSPEQAVLAAKAGAKLVSPFAGRIDDYLRKKKLGMKKGEGFQKTDYYPAEGVEQKGEVVHDNGIVSGVDLIWKTVEIFRNYDFDCEVLAASARNARQVREFMMSGAHVTTMPFSVLNELTAHHKTVEGVISFSKDTVPAYKELLQDDRRFKINFAKE